MHKKIVVVGAAGHVGSAVFKRLSEMDEDVVSLDRGDYDVAARDILVPKSFSFDALIYCVGHCPRGGFLDAIKRPLSQYPFEWFRREIDMHIWGPFNAFQEFLPRALDNSHFVFMSSAATRLLQMPRDARPPIHIYHHLAAIAAEDALIEGMRMDPEVKKRNIKIHRIAPPAIGDSPFHNGSEGPRPPMTVTTTSVVDAIVKSLLVGDHVDLIFPDYPFELYDPQD